MTRQSIIRVIEELSGLFNKVDKAAMLKGYHIALDDISDTAIEAGLITAIKETSDFFPSPGKFRSYCRPQTSEDDIAEYAYQLALRNANAYRGAVFQDPCIAEAIRNTFGTWQKFCRTPYEEHKYAKKEWKSMYLTLRRSGKKYQERLLGDLDTNEPKYVGFTHEQLAEYELNLLEEK